MKTWIAQLFEHPELLRMGHAQRADDLNLGLGWLYYGLARTLRPRTVVVIGSYRGFVPLVFGRALADNREGGSVLFIDPSLVDDFWRDPASVEKYFTGLGVENVCHFLMTTQEFVQSDAYAGLGEVGIVFVDGHHSPEQARFDYEAFAPFVPDDGVVLFHDTRRERTSKVYGPDHLYRCDVKRLIRELRQDPALQVLDLPWGEGITLVRRPGEEGSGS